MAGPAGRISSSVRVNGLYVDQPARGRSAWQPDIDGKLTTFPAERIEQLFTAPRCSGNGRRRKSIHSGPGAADRRPVFDAFYATQVEYLADNAETQRLNQAAGAALLDRIGPAIILTHSQSGPFGWVIADARPKLVKAIIAVEPSGPPFEDAVPREGAARAWGVADIPITYDPPIADPSEIKTEQEETVDAPDLVRCRLQQAPPHRLVNLINIPVLLVTAEASYHSVYDHCTVKYLSQAGVKVTAMPLADHGVHGNGHMW